MRKPTIISPMVAFWASSPVFFLWSALHSVQILIYHLCGKCVEAVDVEYASF